MFFVFFNAISVWKCIIIRIIRSHFSFPVGFANDPIFHKLFQICFLNNCQGDCYFCVSPIQNFQVQKTLRISTKLKQELNCLTNHVVLQNSISQIPEQNNIECFFFFDPIFLYNHFAWKRPLRSSPTSLCCFFSCRYSWWQHLDTSVTAPPFLRKHSM